MKRCFIFCSLGVMMLLKGSAQGVKFIEEKSWEDLLKRAKKEHKYIFLDCFTTWCKPCKRMETEVFTNEKVAEAINDRFLSARVQMDTTKADVVYVKKWYNAAKKIGKLYGVRSYPTFLFFSPDGDIIHKSIGFKSSGDFIVLSSNSLDKHKQYYLLLKRLQSNVNLPDSTLLYLLKSARELKDISASRRVARHYINAIETGRSGVERYNIDVLREIPEFLETGDTKVFSFFYKDAVLADSLFEQKGYAAAVVKNVITREEINAYVIEDNDYNRPRLLSPDWKEIADRIDRKYGSGYSGELILLAQRNYYKWAKPDSKKLAEAHIAYFKKYSRKQGLMEMAGINNQIWKDVFIQIHDKVLLKAAADIMLEIIKNDDMQHVVFIDTYANLLYKAGEVEDAKLWQSRAVEKRPDDKGNVENYEKMKAGIPTWPVK